MLFIQAENSLNTTLQGAFLFPCLAPPKALPSLSLPHPDCSKIIAKGRENNLPDLNLPQTSLRVLVQVDVDGEMCVDVAHLVLETLGDAGNEVDDDAADSAQRSHVLARTVVHLDLDDILGRLGEVDGKVRKVLLQLAARALDGHDAGLDVDLDCWEREVVWSVLTARRCGYGVFPLRPVCPPSRCSFGFFLPSPCLPPIRSVSGNGQVNIPPSGTVKDSSEWM